MLSKLESDHPQEERYCAQIHWLFWKFYVGQGGWLHHAISIYMWAIFIATKLPSKTRNWGESSKSHLHLGLWPECIRNHHKLNRRKYIIYYYMSIHNVYVTYMSLGGKGCHPHPLRVTGWVLTFYEPYILSTSIIGGGACLGMLLSSMGIRLSPKAKQHQDYERFFSGWSRVKGGW